MEVQEDDMEVQEEAVSSLIQFSNSDSPKSGFTTVQNPSGEAHVVLLLLYIK